MAQENQKEVNDMDGIGVRKAENNKVRLSRITGDPASNKSVSGWFTARSVLFAVLPGP